jgi:hypothetical protein
VENGLLIGSGMTSHLFSARGDYVNFPFRVEAKINRRGNSGQYFRTAFGPGFPAGCEAQIYVGEMGKIKTGSLYLPNVPQIHVTGALHGPDEYFTQEVIASGTRSRFWSTT